ncbi:hypothetical protein DL771_005730 [Monosporascus sp. 5C6A]|nr:hypothetical protein DL771_005730 [Monosporascus sp. 5C6A]
MAPIVPRAKPSLGVTSRQANRYTYMDSYRLQSACPESRTAALKHWECLGSSHLFLDMPKWEGSDGVLRPIAVDVANDVILPAADLGVSKSRTYPEARNSRGFYLIDYSVQLWKGCTLNALERSRKPAFVWDPKKFYKVIPDDISSRSTALVVASSSTWNVLRFDGSAPTTRTVFGSGGEITSCPTLMALSGAPSTFWHALIWLGEETGREL